MSMMTSGIILSPLTFLRIKPRPFYGYARGKMPVFGSHVVILRDFVLKFVGINTPFMDRKHVQVVCLKNVAISLTMAKNV